MKPSSLEQNKEQELDKNTEKLVNYIVPENCIVIKDECNNCTPQLNTIFSVAPQD